MMVLKSVEETTEANRAEVVALVNVALLPNKLLTFTDPSEEVAAKRLVELAVVAKELVDVTCPMEA